MKPATRPQTYRTCRAAAVLASALFTVAGAGVVLAGAAINSWTLLALGAVLALAGVRGLADATRQ